MVADLPQLGRRQVSEPGRNLPRAEVVVAEDRKGLAQPRGTAYAIHLAQHPVTTRRRAHLLRRRSRTCPGALTGLPDGRDDIAAAGPAAEQLLQVRQDLLGLFAPEIQDP